LQQATKQLATLELRPGYGWYVTPSRITMIVVEAPGEVKLGSPDNEPGRDASDESQWTCTMDWSFAISAMEITQSQYLDICPEYGHSLNENAPEPDCPVNAVTWSEAQRFCRLLSERDGFAESEMTIPPGDEAEEGPLQDALARAGYRLPVEAEWEVSCRAGTVTPRYFGYAPDLLSSYACYIGNSQGRTWRVGRGWPNPFGLFDVLGNVSEWCQDEFATHPRGGRPRMPRGTTRRLYVASRGNEYTSNEAMVRAANRKPALASEASSYARGFRIARTIKPTALGK
jgi:formylglycine-generating enzyme required for sulfatase activity